MEPNYFHSTWTQSSDFAPPVHEYTEGSTYCHSYEQPYGLSMGPGFEHYRQDPPSPSVTQDAMQQGSGFCVPPASFTTNIYSGGPHHQGYGLSTSGIHAVSLSHILYLFLPIITPSQQTSTIVGPTHNSHGPNNLDSLHELQQVCVSYIFTGSIIT